MNNGYYIKEKTSKMVSAPNVTGGMTPAELGGVRGGHSPTRTLLYLYEYELDAAGYAGRSAQN